MSGEEAGEHAEELARIDAPYRREVLLQSVRFESGMSLLRVRIREGRARFTILDIDRDTARAWGSAMLAWAERPDAGSVEGDAEDPSTSRPDRTSRTPSAS
ncbi:MAG: hypothetical protein KDJ37_08060 [Hyphomicrobiaceae bacterium]|nr:hypothetical protein [Hyphomicrobiaceae bacterium]